MNSLSWMLWLSHVVEVSHAVCVVFCFFAGIALSIMSVALTVGMEGMDPPIRDRLRAIYKPLCGALVAAVLFLILVPSKTIILAIAASQAGQAAIETPEGKEIKNEALRVIRDWLKSQQREEGKK